MDESILISSGSGLRRVPAYMWQAHVTQNAHESQRRLDVMSAEHHVVRNFVVRELPRVGTPIPPELITRSLNIPLSRVQAILDELEMGMTFLFRDENGAVAWAYPVTTTPTPHRVRFSSGEQIYAA